MRPTLFAPVAAAVLVALSQAPTAAAAATAAPVAVEATSDQLRLPPPKAGRARPLVVVVAENAGAETTDFIIPYGVLKESGVADVRSLSTAAGPVQLRMSIRVAADQTLTRFDAEQPAGADVVIVPAMLRPDDAALAGWLRAQAAKGATIVSVCEGARVLAHAGLLDRRRATTHWHAIKELEKRYPATTWVRDRRYLQDGPIISTTGVSASIPMSLALVEAIGGRQAALSTARRLGAAGWSAAHRTADYVLTPADYASAAMRITAVWDHETVEAPVATGIDEIGMALRADAWSRSFRAKVVTTSSGHAPVRSRHGLAILPDQTPQPGRVVIPVYKGPTLQQLDDALAGVERRYGYSAARMASLTMEYRPARSPGL